MTVEEQLAVIASPDNIMIVQDAEKEKDQEVIYKGYKGLISYEKLPDGIMEREVKKLRIYMDTCHKNWRGEGLLPPIEPEKTPNYSFSDLQVTIYRKIII